MYNIIVTPVVKRYLKKIKEKTLLLKYKTTISKIQRQPFICVSSTSRVDVVNSENVI